MAWSYLRSVVTLESALNKQWLKIKNIIKIQDSINLSQWGQGKIVEFQMEKELV